jgi:hypothetical protein
LATFANACRTQWAIRRKFTQSGHPALEPFLAQFFTIFWRNFLQFFTIFYNFLVQFFTFFWRNFLLPAPKLVKKLTSDFRLVFQGAAHAADDQEGLPQVLDLQGADHPGVPTQSLSFYFRYGTYVHWVK